MHADLSRDTFDPARNFARVLMQQGRVPLDADLNEQAAILLHYLRTLAADLIGPLGGGPRGGDLGFAIARTGDAFTVGPGRYYVDGILVESAETRPVPVEPGAGNRSLLLYLDVWERHVTALHDARIREVALGGPDTATRVQVAWRVGVWSVPPSANVDTFVKAELDAVWGAFVKANAGGGRGTLAVRAGSPRTDSYDPCILAPDARYRRLENQLYRVEIHEGGRRAGGEVRPSTFKWSRENGSVLFSLRSLEGDTAEVETLGLDARLDLSPGDWVEITDDVRAGQGESFLVQVLDVDRDQMRITLDDQDDVELPVYGPDDAGRHPVMRRWDHTAPAAGTAGERAPRVEEAGGILRDGDASGPDDRAGMRNGSVVVVPGAWMELEDGIAVRFAADGDYAPGDHWLIPARVATGDVEWPRDGGEPAYVRARRVEHHYAPLALVSLTEGIRDWRQCIRPVADLCGASH